MRWTAAALAAAALAGFEVGGASFHRDLSAYAAAAPSFRLVAGYRQGPWALVGSLGADVPDFFFIDCYGDECGTGPTTSLSDLSVDVKRIAPVAGPLALYVRGRIGTLWAHGDLEGSHALALGAGAGVQLSGRIRAAGLLCPLLYFTRWGPTIHAAVYLDRGVERAALPRAAGRPIAAAVTRTTLGFALGGDF